MSDTLQDRRGKLEQLLRSRMAYASACVHTLFERWADSTPDSIALVSDDRQISYGALERRANQLAHYLRNLGVGPDIRVGIHLSRGGDLALAILGVMKCGAAYVPLDPQMPPNRLAKLIDDIQAPVILTTESLLGELPSVWANVVALDSDWPMIAQEDSRRPDAAAVPGNLAYVLYTSGSTGTPKGVEVEHRNLANYVSGVAERLQLGRDSYAMVSTFGADLGNTVLFGSLCLGGALHVIDAETARDALKLGRYFERQRIDVLKITPSHLAMLLGAFENKSLVPLKTLIIGGEASDAAWIASVQRLRPECRIWNHYGPTETAVGVLTQPLSLGAELPKTIALGRPIANTQAHVLDASLEPVGPGVAGELYIGGANVARGYHHRPGLTAERFVPNPFGDRLGARLYRTGDMVSWQSDGALEFLGRADDQIKIRGFRVEPGEIEAALLEEPGIRQARVILREDIPGEVKLVAYAAAASDSFDPVALRSSLAVKLPDYMVPSALVRLDELPLNANGKLDRKALPKPEQPVTDAENDAPRTAMEEILAGIWSDVLHVENVGRNANFFELGGHSLLATQAVSRIRSLLAVDLPLQVLFDQRTFAGVASEVERCLQMGQGSSAPPLLPAEGPGPDWPLSFAQQRLWVLDQLEPGSAVYHIPRALRLHGALDFAALRRSLNEIVRRHAVLRTAFPDVDGLPVQRVEPSSPVAFPLVDLSGLDKDAAENAARRIAVAISSRPFNLSAGPLFRCALLRMAPEDNVLLVTLHHIVTDAWSTGIFARELSALYQAYASGGHSPLEELPIQYKDFAVWQRRWLQGEALDRQMAYWGGQLSGLEPVSLPTDHPRPATPGYVGGMARIVLDAGLRAKLQEVCREEGVTLFMAMLAAWQLQLSRYAGQDDIAVGTPIAGRNRVETDDLIGFFVNTLVMRTNLGADSGCESESGGRTPTFTELLGRVRATSFAAYAHQDIPFEQLVEEFAPARDLSRHPLFQVMLMVTAQNGSVGALSLKELNVAVLEGGDATAKFDLTLDVAESADTLVIDLVYAADLFDRSSIDQMLGHFRNLLEGIVASPTSRISDLALFSDAERRQLLTVFNDTSAEYPRKLCVHHLFAEQARQSPDAVALVFEDVKLTYADLDTRSNLLANYLQSLGVGPEVRVGLLVERSPDMVIGLLGILKAGGAYVPLDPEYPAERISYILADSGVRVLVTREGLLKTLTPLNPPLEQGGGKKESPLEQGGGQINPLIGLDRNLLSPSCSKEGLGEVPEGLESGTLASPPYEGGGWGEVICLDRDWEKIAQSGGECPSPAVSPENLAYAIYTSGSTGKPKGVGIPHDALHAFLFAMQQRLGLTPQDTLLAVTTLSFDIAGLEIYLPLITGGRVEIASRDVVMDGERLAEAIAGSGATIMQATPATWRMLFDTGWSGSPNLTMLCGGEALSPALAHALLACGGSVWNMYGPTETTIWSLMHPISASEGAPLIGRPIANTRAYILDRNFEPCPLGAIGELYIGGAGLARGYVNRPELTAGVFLPNPFSAAPGARLYRTGDLARCLSDGRIQCLGRIDNQVKVRGFRIELGEIEAALAQYPGVSASVAVARADESGGNRLVAYLVTQTGQPADHSELRTFLNARLPDYMVPSAFVVLDRLPLTPNGKIDRKALPEPDKLAHNGGDHVPPRTETEKELADIWRRILRLESVGVNDNFFDIGGHSLLATQVVSQVRRRFRIDLPLAALFQMATISQLAGHVDAITWANAGQIPPSQESGLEFGEL